MSDVKVVERLKKNLDVLLDNYDKYVVSDTKKAIESLRLIRDTTKTINDLDYELMYSTYKMKSNDSDEFRRVISIWNQNSNGDIKDHRIWEVGSELELGTLEPIKHSFSKEELSEVIVEDTKNIDQLKLKCERTMRYLDSLEKGTITS